MPGALVEGFNAVRRPADLLKVLRVRLKEQKKIYGTLSKLPMYRVSMRCADDTRLDSFRVAVVQSRLPEVDDFCRTDITQWTSAFRKRHRRHLAYMCRLVHAHLAALETSQAGEGRPEYLDLIVFPELSVHPDDMDLLYRLSDRTRAAIFAGQTHLMHAHYKQPINRGVWVLRTRSRGGRQLLTVYQGKQFPTALEHEHKVKGHRPYQLLIELMADNAKSCARLTGSICYDATDLKLAADLRDVSDLFVIAALNKDINTFDAMTEALHYHMYQPVVLANTGEFGGSNAVAPYTEHHKRFIAHVHGNKQAAVSLFAIDLLSFKIKPASLKNRSRSSPKQQIPTGGMKTPPAGYLGRG